MELQMGKHNLNPPKAVTSVLAQFSLYLLNIINVNDVIFASM